MHKSLGEVVEAMQEVLTARGMRVNMDDARAAVDVVLNMMSVRGSAIVASNGNAWIKAFTAGEPTVHVALVGVTAVNDGLYGVFPCNDDNVPRSWDDEYEDAPGAVVDETLLDDYFRARTETGGLLRRLKKQQQAVAETDAQFEDANQVYCEARRKLLGR